MKKLAPLCILAIFTLVSAVVIAVDQAHADVLQVTITGGVNGNGNPDPNVSFLIDSQPTTLPSTTGAGFVVDTAVTEGSITTTPAEGGSVTFYITADNVTPDGVHAHDLTVGGASVPEYGGVQLFTGSTSDPTIVTGTYSIYDVFNPQDLATIVIEDITAPVPELSTWAMMILGFLGLGFTAYRKKSALGLA